MKNIGKRGKTAKAIAMLLILCMALCAALGGCGKDNGKEPAEASENGGKPARYRDLGRREPHSGRPLRSGGRGGLSPDGYGVYL